MEPVFRVVWPALSIGGAGEQHGGSECEGRHARFCSVRLCLCHIVICSIDPIFLSFREAVLEQLQQLQCAPSVQMQDVPRESVRQHLGFGRDDEVGRDELDEKLARTRIYVFLTFKRHR